jgi:hypothetical protein
MGDVRQAKRQCHLITEKQLDGHISLKKNIAFPISVLYGEINGLSNYRALILFY